MRSTRLAFVIAAVAVAWAPVATRGQGGRSFTPAPQATQPEGRQGSQGRQGRSGPAGAGRGGVEVMTLTSAAWPDGGHVPVKYTQSAEEVSPPLSWANVPAGVVTFVLIAHDVDAAIGVGTEDLLHWMLWNIPATVTALPEHLPAVSELPDGTRQISATGPFYRGPGASGAGPPHHYVFELYALDVSIDVPAVGASPAQTRAAVMSAMAGHVRGKGVYVGLFKRSV